MTTTWAQDAPPVLISLRHDDVFLAEKIGTLGFDGVVVDMQHGEIGYEQVYLMLTALGHSASASVVRLPANDPALAMKVLDAGAQAVVCPAVETPEEVASFVDACRYPPMGYRSLGPNRAAMVPGYLAGANESVLTFVAVESEVGYAALDRIVQVENLDGLLLEGPRDLVLSGIERTRGCGKTVLTVLDADDAGPAAVAECGVVMRDDLIYLEAMTGAAGRLNAAARVRA